MVSKNIKITENELSGFIAQVSLNGIVFFHNYVKQLVLLELISIPKNLSELYYCSSSKQLFDLANSGEVISLNDTWGLFSYHDRYLIALHPTSNQVYYFKSSEDKLSLLRLLNLQWISCDNKLLINDRFIESFEYRKKLGILIQLKFGMSIEFLSVSIPSVFLKIQKGFYKVYRAPVRPLRFVNFKI